MANPDLLSSGALSLLDADLAAAIARETDDVVFAKDTASRYRFANPATLARLGRPLEEVIGRTDEEILQDRAATARRMAADLHVITTGETSESEEPIANADGSMSFLLVRKMPLRDALGRVSGVLGIGRDITQRKQAELRAEADRLKLQMAIQAAGLVTAEIDYRSNLNHISGELARLMELGDGPMVVPRQAIFDRIHEEDRPRYLEAIARTVDPAGSGHLAIDVRARMPSGTEKWLHIVLQVTFSPIDGQMRPDRGICAAADVTGRVLAEQRLREADRRKDEFIAMLAHELRNPLAPIRNGLELLNRLPDMPPSSARVREIMDRQLRHLVRLIDDLLDVSRITGDRLDLRMQPLTLQEVVDHALEASRPGIEAAGHTLGVSLPREPVRLQGDLTRLAQVVSNLLNNSAKYTPRGGRIDLGARVEGEEVVLEVRDNGSGIAPDVLPCVFDLFTQGHQDGSGSQGGMGIGLWLVKKLVGLHGGRIDAASDGVHGCVFTVHLPLRSS